jgi:hypothetical protein
VTKAPLEKTISAKIIKALRETAGPDGWFVKIPGGPSLAGIPDILGCYRGRFVAFEVKRPGGSYGVTERQQHHLNMIAQAGGVSAIVDSVEGALEAISQIA